MKNKNSIVGNLTADEQQLLDKIVKKHRKDKLKLQKSMAKFKRDQLKSVDKKKVRFESSFDEIEEDKDFFLKIMTIL